MIADITYTRAFARPGKWVINEIYIERIIGVLKHYVDNVGLRIVYKTVAISARGFTHKYTRTGFEITTRRKGKKKYVPPLAIFRARKT